MTNRPSELSSKDCYSGSESRLNHRIRCETTVEGCPVIEESGTVCGETNTINIFEEFRQIFDECLKKLEKSHDGTTLKKLAPFQKLIEDLWEQNTMLVETVEELEQEAACRVTNLQNKLNKSCQKEFQTMLKTKESEVKSLSKQLLEKNDLIKKYCCQIDELKKDLKAKNKKYEGILKQLKCKTRNECNEVYENNIEDDFYDCNAMKLEVDSFLEIKKDEQNSAFHQFQSPDLQFNAITSENKYFLMGKKEIANQSLSVSAENERLVKEKVEQKKVTFEKEELLKTIDQLKLEKRELTDRVNFLQENNQELKNNFKDTRWALTSEVAEKHDQIQGLKRCVGVLEEQLRQADMQTHFKNDIIKELRKELKNTQKSVPSLSEAGLNRHYTALSCLINNVEETLRNLSSKHGCGLSDCKILIEQEMEKIRSVKNDLKTLEINNSKNQFNRNSDEYRLKVARKSQGCGNLQSKSYSENELQNSKCSLVHLEDVETFREKAVSGFVILEQMKEQIDALENLIKKYINEFPCECDENQVTACEKKLEKLHVEFADVTEQLCHQLQKLNKSLIEESCDSLNSYDDTLKYKVESANFESGYFLEDITKLRSERQQLHKEICDKENAAERLKILLNQVDEELQQKRSQLIQHNKELDEKVDEIVRLREIIQKVGHKLKQMHFSQKKINDVKDKDFLTANTSHLSSLFCELEEFRSTLEISTEALLDIPKKLIEDNEKLKEKLTCLEKCVCNKEETLRVLQDTVKLRECQIEEFKSRMQHSENQSAKLAQDVEEKCRLIANLQEAMRKCKQFEENVRSAQINSLEFELCKLDCKMKKSEKEIFLRNRKMENLHNEVTTLCSKNVILTQEAKLTESRLKSLYKVCYLFEKMVNNLQEELNSRDCEVESLYEKIKDLENELEEEFKKCENRAIEDSKCIKELSLTLKNFQNDLCSAQENYNASIAHLERQLKNEQEMSQLRESELIKTICLLKAEKEEIQSQVEENNSAGRISNLECIVQQTELQQQVYKKKITELQKVLEYTILEHEEERKCILQKLCEEKKENLKNKTLVTKLNENIKREIINERTLKENINRFTEEYNNLKTENQELKTEIEARKKIMCAIEKEENINLSEMEELICHLKIQKAEIKAKYYNLKAEVDKEVKLKNFLECRVQDLNTMLESRLEEFNKMTENYKNTSSEIQETLGVMKKVEKSLTSFENNIKQTFKSYDKVDESEYLKKLLDMKTAENAKLISQLQILKVEIESNQTENVAIQANKDSLISHLRHEANCLENDLQELKVKHQKLIEENKRIRDELDRRWIDKETSIQTEFKEKQKELCAKLRTTISEKNDLLSSLDELQKQLELICLENVNKEKLNRELSKECSRLKINNEKNDNQFKNKSDKIICTLNKEVKNLHCELYNMKETYTTLNCEYQKLIEQFKICEKKKSNLEKLFVEVSNENKNLQKIIINFEKELCELKTQNVLLKNTIVSKEKNLEEKKKCCGKLKDLTIKIKNLEKKVIPELEKQLKEKNCYIENIKIDLEEANISSQEMRNEALNVIRHTKKYLVAQKCANETLKTCLECSDKRKNMLGAENRELEDQLKAVTRMNEYLMYQLESTKKDIIDIEPRSSSPLDWNSSMAEKDTSSSEYLGESGIQSMQPSPTNMDYIHEYNQDFKRSSPQCNNLKKKKCGGFVSILS